MKVSTLAILFVAVVAAVDAADPAAPAKAKNANIATPGDSPKQALTKLVTAIQAGDVEAVRSYITVDENHQPVVADRWAAALTCTGRLDKAIREKLGAKASEKWKEQWSQFGGLWIAKRLDLKSPLEEIEAAKFQPVADGASEAELTDTGRVLLYFGRAIRLHQVDNAWKIDMQDWLGVQPGAKPKPYSDNLVYNAYQTEAVACNQIAEQLEQGKLKTYEEFFQAAQKAAQPEGTFELKPFFLEEGSGGQPPK